MDLMLSLTENPHSSVVTLALNNEDNCSTVHRFLKSEKLHPYKPILVQELLENNYDTRLEFCEEMMARIDTNNAFSSNILFSDEATFCLNGQVNRQNYRFWFNAGSTHWGQCWGQQRSSYVWMNEIALAPTLDDVGARVGSNPWVVGFLEKDQRDLPCRSSCRPHIGLILSLI